MRVFTADLARWSARISAWTMARLRCLVRPR
jgi:hypothetical protein